MPNFYLVLHHTNPDVVTDAVQTLIKVGFKDVVRGIGTDLGFKLPPNILTLKSASMEYVEVMNLAKTALAYRDDKIKLMVIRSHRAQWVNLDSEL